MWIHRTYLLYSSTVALVVLPHEGLVAAPSELRDKDPARTAQRVE